mmetsp:Transcript_6645/g.11323  ORF Transcript_6645/g.11323 Transcript_6645/m.11323 type:complete len:554 (-) Transcript_6645:126-1787(-)
MARETESCAASLLEDERRTTSHRCAGKRWSSFAVGCIFVAGVVLLNFRSVKMNMVMTLQKLGSWAKGEAEEPFCTNIGDEDNQFCMPLKLTSADTPPFNSYEMNLIYLYFLGNMNVQGIGGVLASPDKETPGGSYFFHWERDAALSIRTMVAVREGYTDYKTSMMKNLRAYINWCDKLETASTPNGIEIIIEPKFELPHGNVFTGDWCRPQNDAPGLKAIALIEYAYMMWEEGENATIDELIKDYFWTNDITKKKGGIIFRNMEYVVHNWAAYTCDLWEEVSSNDIFWNRLTMKKALLMASRFARQLGNTTQAEIYDTEVRNMDLKGWTSHWNESARGGSLFVKEIGEKTLRGRRECDAAVILAFNHGWDAPSGQWAPHEYAVAKTVLEYNRIFTQEYLTNTQDTQDHVGGILYGRYPKDDYAGGNAWIMTTGALAQLLYRAAWCIKQHGLPAEYVMQVWRQALHMDLVDDKDIMALKFATAADAVLLRVSHHIRGDNFHMFEQIGSSSGRQVGARDLTWSYAEVLWAMHARKQFFDLEANSTLGLRKDASEM